MKNIIISEHIKLKHTFGQSLPIIAPILTILLVLLLTGGIGNTLPAGAWNWWYSMLLPGMLAIIAYQSIQKDKKIKYHNILSANFSITKVWIGKVIYCSLVLVLSNFIVFIGTLLGGAIFGTTISPLSGLVGAIVLSISYIWALPLFMMLSARFGMFISIFLSMALSIFSVAFLAETRFWWILPFSVPIRLMCPVLGILPNGLPVPAESLLNNVNVMFPGILISIVWFLILTYLSALWFYRTEGKR